MKKLLILLFLLPLFSLAQQQNHYIPKENIIEDYIKVGSCGSPDGPVLQIASPPVNYNQLLTNGYCNYSYPTTATFTACFTFVSPGTSVSLNAGYSASCATVKFSGFTLYNSSCAVIGTGLNFSGLTPGASYTWCLTMRANGGPSCNGFTTFCPYFMNTTPLPVNLIEYTAKVEDSIVKLEWLTLSEINADYYYIEKSTDLVKISSLEQLSAAGNTNIPTKYRTFDLKPEKGINYYTLKQVDFDGTVYDLGTKAVVIKHEIHEKINIYNSKGQYIGNSLSSDLSPGLYIIEKIFLNGSVETTKIVIR